MGVSSLASPGNRFDRSNTGANALRKVRPASAPLKLTMENYKALKIIGRGSFGCASLFERLSDGLVLVSKQINVGELTPKEQAGKPRAPHGPCSRPPKRVRARDASRRCLDRRLNWGTHCCSGTHGGEGAEGAVPS